MPLENATYSERHGLFYDHFFAMGTRFDLLLTEIEEGLARRAAERVTGEVNRIEKLLSTFDKEARTFIINETAHASPVPLEKELWDAFTMAGRFHEQTAGLFDITIKPLKDHASAHEGPVPDSVLRLTGMQNLVLDPQERTVFFRKKGCSVDFGGIGKGIALDRVRKLFEELHVSNAFASFGESSVLGMGRHPHGTCWKAGIRNMKDPATGIVDFEISDQALSTSGSMAGDSPEDAVPHIFHPGKGWSLMKEATVSVLTNSASEAEVLSTALLLAEPEELAFIRTNFRGVQWTRIDYEGEQSHINSSHWE